MSRAWKGGHRSVGHWRRRTLFFVGNSGQWDRELSRKSVLVPCGGHGVVHRPCVGRAGRSPARGSPVRRQEELRGYDIIHRALF